MVQDVREHPLIHRAGHTQWLDRELVLHWDRLQLAG
jgi:hypothetical protein